MKDKHKIMIRKLIQLEIDGIFKIENFIVSKFNKNEINIIF